jgi:hypothetical protein
MTGIDIDWNLAARRDLPVVCWDLDSTLCSTWHRQHMIPAVKAGEKTWDQYAELCAGDEPIEGAVELVRLLAPHNCQIAVSGRSGSAKALTLEWLRTHGVPLDRTIMRPDGDFTENGLLKVKVIRQLQRQGLDVRLFIEDWPQAAELIREQTGVPVLVVNPCYPDEGAKLGHEQEKAIAGGES